MSSEILLILPSFDFEEDTFSKDSISPPLGLLYMAAVLQERGYSVKVLDMDAENIKTEKKFIKFLRGINPNLIGISSLTKRFDYITNLISLCKKEYSDIPIVLGAHFATFNYDKIMPKYKDVDFIVRNEAEETIIELADELEVRKPKFNKIRGIVYRDKGKIKINKDRPLLRDLDSLPFPAYDLVSHLEYRKLGAAQISKNNIGSIITSRGCHYKCIYCACNSFTGGTIRYRKPKKVFEEIKHFHDKFGMRNFLIVDDNFTSDKKHVLKICDMIRENGLDIEWYAEGRVNQANSEMFDNMVKAGAKVTYFGIESCVDRILKYYRKGITFEMSKDAVKKAQKSGLDVIGSFIFGAPIETVDEMWETVRKSTTMDLDFVQYNVLAISRGIPLWNHLVKQGIIDDSRWEEVIYGFEINPKLKLEEMLIYLDEFNRKFYYRKSYLMKQIWKTLLRRRKQLLLNMNNLGDIISDIRDVILQKNKTMKKKYLFEKKAKSK